MKRLILPIALAALSLPLLAHRAPITEAFHVTIDKLPSTGVWMAVGNTSAVWNITNSGIQGSITTLTYNGKSYPAFQYTGTAAVKLNIRHSRTNSPIPNEKTTANGYIRVADQVQYLVLVKRTGTATAAITPTFTFRKTKLSTIDTAGKVQTIRNWNNTADSTVTATATITYKPTDGNTKVPTDGITPYIFNAEKWSNHNQQPSVEYVNNDLYFFRHAVYTDGNIILDKFQPGDIVTVISWSHGQDICNKVAEADNGWTFPVLRLNNRAKKTVINTSAYTSTENKSIFSQEELPVGEHWIQAEDFDEPWINNRVSHSATLSTNDWADAYGYGGRDRTYDVFNGAEASGNIRVDAGMNPGVDVGVGGFTSYDGNGGYRATANSPADFGLSNFTQKNWDDKFKNNNDPAKLDNLANDYGAYTEYTFRVEENMYADFTLNAGLHLTNYNAYRTSPNQAPKIKEQPEKNYIQEYAGTYRLYVDGELQESAWDARPPKKITSINDVARLAKWEGVPHLSPSPRGGVELKAAANNSLNVAPILPAFSHDESGETWNASNKQDLADKLNEKGLVTQREYNFLSTPDFANVYLTAGQHTIKVQSMGGRTTFDAIKVHTHTASDTPTALERIMLTGADNSDDDAPVEFYDLQGRRVENPYGGIFIRRQGSTVKKVVLR